MVKEKIVKEQSAGYNEDGHYRYVHQRGLLLQLQSQARRHSHMTDRCTPTHFFLNTLSVSINFTF